MFHIGREAEDIHGPSCVFLRQLIPQHLRYKEFELLTLLMNRKGQVVDRAEIFDLVWGTDWLGDDGWLPLKCKKQKENL